MNSPRSVLSVFEVGLVYIRHPPPIFSLKKPGIEWYMPVTLVPKRLRQENYLEFEIRTAKICLKIQCVKR